MTAELGRRAMLAGAAVAVATPLVQRATAAAPPTSLVPNDPVLHVVRRLTYGPTPQLVAHVRSIGVAAFVEEQLHPLALAEPELDAVVATFPSLQLPAAAIGKLHEQGLRNAVRDLQAATVLRAAWSRRQLYELMVELWSNHLSIFGDHALARAYKVVDDREVIRPHALGRFRDLLAASAQSQAMLTYLDNSASRGVNPNENYARELLELHTVGIDGGYRQRDVRAAALALTGWTVDQRTGRFAYRPEWRYVGPLRVLGWSARNDDPNRGVEVGLSLVDYLAHHPATARRVAHKLATRFVSDKPSKGLVTALARVYSTSDTDISAVLRALFASAEFRRGLGRKTRRPLEHFAAAVRALGLSYDRQIGLDGGLGLVAAVRALGQLPFDWRPPDGYPDVAGPWTSTAGTLARWNAVLALSRGGVPGVSAPEPLTVVGAPLPATVGELVDRVCVRLLHQRLRGPHRAALLRHLGRAASAPVNREYIAEVTPTLAALVLSTAYAQVR